MSETCVLFHWINCSIKQHMASAAKPQWHLISLVRMQHGDMATTLERPLSLLSLVVRKALCELHFFTNKGWFTCYNLLTWLVGSLEQVTHMLSFLKWMVYFYPWDGGGVHIILLISSVLKFRSFRCQIKPKPHPHWPPSGVWLKFCDEHPQSF